jgi:hypothetical protein
MSGRSEQDPRTGNSLEEFQRDLADNLRYERGTTVESASAQDVYWTLAVTIRDRLADRRVRTARANYLSNPKFVYHLSAEYMLARQLRQNALYTGTADLARQAVAASGFSVEDLETLDVEPGPGNGAWAVWPRPTSKLPPPAGPRRAAEFGRLAHLWPGPQGNRLRGRNPQAGRPRRRHPAGELRAVWLPRRRRAGHQSLFPQAARAPEDGHVMFEFPRTGTFVPTGSARISICLHDELNLAVLFPLGPK